MTSQAFARDGRTLAAGDVEGNVVLWDVSDPEHPHQGRTLSGDDGLVTSVAFTADGRSLFSDSDDFSHNTVAVWSLGDPGGPRRAGSPYTGKGPVAFAPDGRMVAAVDDDYQTGVVLMDTSDPSRRTPMGTPLTGHAAPVSSLAFSPDGRTLAAGSLDDAVILWDVSDPAVPRRLGAPLVGHSQEVTALAFSPDGRTLATGGADHSVLVWDVTDPAAPLRVGPPLTGHTDQVTSLSFSSDGRTLATDGLDHSVQLWDPHGALRAPGARARAGVHVHPGRHEPRRVGEARPRPGLRGLLRRRVIRGLAEHYSWAIRVGGITRGRAGDQLSFSVLDPLAPVMTTYWNFVPPVPSTEWGSVNTTCTGERCGVPSAQSGMHSVTSSWPLPSACVEVQDFQTRSTSVSFPSPHSRVMDGGRRTRWPEQSATLPSTLATGATEVGTANVGAEATCDSPPAHAPRTNTHTVRTTTQSDSPEKPLPPDPGTR